MPDGQVGMPAMELVPRYKEEQVFIIEAFIVHSVRESGRDGVILGLSGGIDSALVAKLCADAIGPGRVLALALPDGKGGRDLKDARKFANAIGIEFRIRSEEHTSELQSHHAIVCRLLLEKKNRNLVTIRGVDADAVDATLV